MAGENQVTRPIAVPREEREGPNRRRRGDIVVIEGRIDLAARLARFFGTTLLVTLVIGLVGALVLHATIIENERDLDARRMEISRLTAETETMRHELAELEAPARIVREAHALGMIEPPTIVYVNAPGGPLDQRTLSIAANELRTNR